MASTMPFEDIPLFFRIPQEERKEAWEKFRAAHPPPRETKPVYRPITSVPGAPNDDPDQS